MRTMARDTLQLKAAQEVLLAAEALHRAGKNEFSEWDLTVQVWLLNNNRFGCRGYEDQYPDHKRVMMELMGKRKNLKQRGWIEKTRENHYRITSLGLAEAARLRGHPRSTHERAVELYRELKRDTFHATFVAHLQSAEEPKTWLGAASFLALPRNDAETLEGRFSRMRTGIEAALTWMDETRQDELTEKDGGGAIDRRRLERLGEFLDVLEERFRPQFDAIRRKRTGR